MISADLKHEVSEWIKHDPDPKTAEQLQQWLDKDDFEKIKDSFSKRINGDSKNGWTRL